MMCTGWYSFATYLLFFTHMHLSGFLTLMHVLFCLVTVCVLFNHLLLSLNHRPVLTGGWGHGHGASGCHEKNLDRERQDLHWNQHQAGETGQRSVDSFPSCSHLYTRGYVSPYVLVVLCHLNVLCSRTQLLYAQQG